MALESLSGTIDGLRSAPEFDGTYLAETLSSLVRCRSVNPGTYEAEMATVVQQLLEGTGCEIEVAEFAPGRPSVAAVLRGSQDDRRLVLNGHMDTVPIDDESRWKSDPFGGEIRDSAVWGRGSVDMKGGLVTQIACARFLARRRESLRGSLVLHFAAGEECGEPGTLTLLDRGYTGDWGIVTEPTNLAVATAMRGVAWYRIRLDGESTHGSARWAGRNPILQVGSVLDALASYDEKIAETEHELMGPGTCTPTMLRAGVEHNAVPDSCEIVLDRRLIPGETPERILADLRELVQAAVDPGSGISWSVEQVHHSFVPAEVPDNSLFVKLVMDTVEAVTGQQRPVEATPYGSDVRNLVKDAGMEAITFGPGEVSKCHCANEHQHVADLQAAALTITGVALDLLTDG